MDGGRAQTQYRWRKAYRGLKTDQARALGGAAVALAEQYDCHVNRRVTARLNAAGWSMNHELVERI